MSVVRRYNANNHGSISQGIGFKVGGVGWGVGLEGCDGRTEKGGMLIWPKATSRFSLLQRTRKLLMQAHESDAVLDDEQRSDECDAFDSDVEGPTTQTMFMTNLTSEDPIYDEVGPSYDSNTPYEVHDHDTFVNHLDEYHEVHEMQTDEQHNYVVDSDADYTSNSNTIPYDQYMEDNEDHVVQRDVSSVRNDALMLILDEMHEQGVQSRLANKPDTGKI
ncbi:hypothetical protein Tco_0570941 [Tanacetum coccineum]